LLSPGTACSTTNKSDSHDIPTIVESGVKNHYTNPLSFLEVKNKRLLGSESG
jgi:hypothetical protein